MPSLLPKQTAEAPIIGVAAGLISQHDLLWFQSAVWMYVDDLNRSHLASQSENTSVGAYWHGIMHRREGDFSNAKYWFRRSEAIHQLLALDPNGLTDEVACLPRSENPSRLVDAQRREWLLLVGYCARQAQ